MGHEAASINENRSGVTAIGLQNQVAGLFDGRLAVPTASVPQKSEFFAGNDVKLIPEFSCMCVSEHTADACYCKNYSELSTLAYQ